MFMCDSVPSDPRVWFSWNSTDGRLDEGFFDRQGPPSAMVQATSQSRCQLTG